MPSMHIHSTVLCMRVVGYLACGVVSVEVAALDEELSEGRERLNSGAPKDLHLPAKTPEAHHRYEKSTMG